MVFKELDDWLEKEDIRAFFITGDPGIGKSAIMAYLVTKHEQVVSYHFCKSNLKDSLDPVRFIQSIAAQLATQLGSYREALNAFNFEELIDLSDPNVLFRRIIADPLKIISNSFSIILDNTSKTSLQKLSKYSCLCFCFPISTLYR